VAEMDIDALRLAIGAADRRGGLVGLTKQQAEAYLAALERAARLHTCGAGHIVEIPEGTPPYESGTCPVCEELERIPEGKP